MRLCDSEEDQMKHGVGKCRAAQDLLAYAHLLGHVPLLLLDKVRGVGQIPALAEDTAKIHLRRRECRAPLISSQAHQAISAHA